jgi:hypothetical protein
MAVANRLSAGGVADERVNPTTAAGWYGNNRRKRWKKKRPSSLESTNYLAGEGAI